MLLAFAVALGLPGAAPAEEPTKITIFAAASLTDVLTDIAKSWKEAGNEDVVFSFAATSALAKQIEQGAPADIFASADLVWMKYLEDRKLIDPAAVWAEIGNELVWIASPTAPQGMVDDPLSLLGDGRLALADPESVPAGKYAKEALTNLGLWDKVKDRVAPAENVRAALVLVEKGEAQLGIVYQTDTRKSQVRVVGSIPSDSHTPIVYPMAILTGHDNAKAKSFFEFMTGPKGLDTFRNYGFIVKASTS